MTVLYLLGSGASVDSGLPTYRGKSGLYENVEGYEEILSFKNYIKNPEIFWDNYLPLYEAIINTEPGPTYKKIKEMINPKDYIFTQNLDKLCYFCSDNCLELHGTYDKTTCIRCGKIEDININKIKEKRYQCGPSCEGLIKPNFTMFGENLNKEIVKECFRVIKTKPRYCVVTGTTLQFPYLTEILNKLKSKGTIVIYIDPNIEFLFEIREKCKRRYMNKIFICSKSYEGLCYINEKFKNDEEFIGDGIIIDLTN